MRLSFPLSARVKVSIPGHERASAGLELSVYTWDCWGKGVTESAGIWPLDVGKTGGRTRTTNFIFFFFFNLQFAVHIAAL